MMNDEMEELARMYGFESYAELRAASTVLPMLPGDTVQNYVARHGKGHWFLWEDRPFPKPEQP